MSIFIKEYQNTLPKEVCDQILDYYVSTGGESNISNKSYNKNAFVKEFYFSDIDDVFWEDTKEKVIDVCNQNIKDYLSFSNLNFHQSYYFRHMSLMHHKENYSVPLHHDDEVDFVNEDTLLRNFIILIYLNNNFEGGDLLFPVQNKIINPVPGKMVILPTSYMFPHLTTPAMGSDRFVLRISYYYKKEIITELIKRDLNVY